MVKVAVRSYRMVVDWFPCPTDRRRAVTVGRPASRSARTGDITPPDETRAIAMIVTVRTAPRLARERAAPEGTDVVGASDGVLKVKVLGFA
jgi:hypothetical protein